MREIKNNGYEIAPTAPRENFLPHPALQLEDLEAYSMLAIAGVSEKPWQDEGLRRYGVALVIGRFQPLHAGHIYLFHRALALADTIIIGIGSANVQNEDNPFSVQVRELLVHRAIQREDIVPRVVNVVPLNDCFNDDAWLKEAIARTGKVDAVIGNNEWVNGIFVGYGIPAIEVPLFNRDRFEGRKIRQQLRQQRKL
ncbi:MAG: adenylyltransferase/cytidyltransferase family protein [Candidatus Levybacteria bacterium]|nr:adenylyltransferase/cytidyltransferase family protein [Candidatus Levybacteria bacterium]